MPARPGPRSSVHRRTQAVGTVGWPTGPPEARGRQRVNGKSGLGHEFLDARVKIKVQETEVREPFRGQFVAAEHTGCGHVF